MRTVILVYCLKRTVIVSEEMDQLSEMTTEDLSSWLMDKQIPMEVIQSFQGQPHFMQ